MSSIEQQLRQDLASCHHIIHYHGWDDLLATHLSARIPDTDTILITPHNVAFEKVTAENLIKCDLDGNVVDGKGLMPQARNIHVPVYKARPDIQSAIHTHSQAGVAVSSLKCGLLFINQQALRFYNQVAYHSYGGLALDNEGDMIVSDLQDKSVMILRNHGLLSTGSSIAEAMYRAYYLEIACEIQVKTLSMGQSISRIDPKACEATYQQFKKIQTVEIDFRALVERVNAKMAIPVL